MRQQPNNQTSKNTEPDAKRLVCQGEVVILLPLPATVQWTISLQRVAELPPLSTGVKDDIQEQEQELKEHEEKQWCAQEVRIRVRRKGRHGHKTLEDGLLNGEKENMDEMNRRLQEQEHKQMQEQLQQQLLTLSPPAFERLLSRVMERTGYSDLQSLPNGQSITHTRKQALRGMVHLRARLGSGQDVLTVLMTAKRYDYPVSRRFVDELRGAMLRHEAQLGLLVTTGTFPPAAKRAVQENAHLPITLMDGAQLRSHLADYGLGAERLTNGLLSVDPSFFAHLEAEVAAEAAQIPR